MPPDFRNAIDLSRKLVTGFMNRMGVPGISLAVAVHGRIVWSEGFGFADAGNGVHMNADSVGRVGSVSKMFTLLAAAKLMDEGKLDIDQPVQRYLPLFPAKTWNNETVTITTRHLLTHTSGIRHYRKLSQLRALVESGGLRVLPESVRDAYEICPKTNGSLPPEFYIRKNFASVSEGVGLFRDDPLICQPGYPHYSSCGWILLSAIIESLVDRPFGDHMEDLFDTLGFDSTSLEMSDAIVTNRMRYYSRDGRNNLLNAPHVDCSWKIGSGGFLSSAIDLLRMSSVYLHSCFSRNRDGFLAPETVRHMWTPNSQWVDEQGTVGLGWYTNTNRVDLVRRPCHQVFHTGRGVGFGAVVYNAIDGEDFSSASGGPYRRDNHDIFGLGEEGFRGTTVAMLGNLNNVNLEFVSRDIAYTFLRPEEQISSADN